jgi:uncharacterized protein YciI
MTARVTAAIERHFAEADRAAVAELLAGYVGESEQGTERIHLLILRMSRRDVERVRSLLDAARRDYRDVILWEAQPTRTYIVGLLRRGPNAQPRDKTTLKPASLKKWKNAGMIVIGGPFLDESDPKGLYLFTLDSVEVAREIVSEDPGIQAGMLAFEFHPWRTVDGLQVGVPKDFLEV